MTTTTPTTPSTTKLTVRELATRHADSEILRVQGYVATDLGTHPMGLSPDAWTYVHDLLVVAYEAGMAEGGARQMADINIRYTLRPRR